MTNGSVDASSRREPITILDQGRDRKGAAADAPLRREPILVLGLGNLLLGDDGAGLRLLEELAARKAADWEDAVALLDGGTLGLALIGELSGRRAVVILDALRAGAEPGTVHLLRSPRAARGALYVQSGGGSNGTLPYGRGSDAGAGPATAHDANAQELIAAVALLGNSPEELFVVGIEPENIATGIGLSDAVEGAIRPALERAVEIVERLLPEYVSPIRAATVRERLRAGGERPCA